MVEQFPVGCEPSRGIWPKHWDEYFTIRSDYDKEIVGDKNRAWQNANDYYLENREVMDEGSDVTWDHAYSEARCESSTIQAAMNYIADYGWESFSSECQNEAAVQSDDENFLTRGQITEKQHAQKKGVVPADATTVVGFIDVQQEMFFFEVWAYTDKFTGYKISGGEWPDQKSLTFEKSDLKQKLSKKYPQTNLEARLKIAVIDLWKTLLEAEFKRTDGTMMQISMLGTDVGYKGTTIESAYLDMSPSLRSRIQLCAGFGYTAKKKPLRFKTIKRGNKKGFGYFLGDAKRGIQTLETDVNLLKTFFHQRFATPIGDPGSFSLWKASPNQHWLTASHYKAEYRVTLDGPFGIVDEWQPMPGRPDNDRLDCGVGCVAIASLQGISMAGADYEELGGVKRRKIDPSRWGKKR